MYCDLAVAIISPGTEDLSIIDFKTSENIRFIDISRCYALASFSLCR